MDRCFTFVVVAEYFNVGLWLVPHEHGYIALVLDLGGLTLGIRLALDRVITSCQLPIVLRSAYFADEPAHFDNNPFLFFLGPESSRNCQQLPHLLVFLAHASLRSCFEGSYFAKRQVPYDRLATRDEMPTGARAGW